MGFFTGSNKTSNLIIDSNLTMGLSYQTLNRKIAAGAAVLDSEDAVVQVTSGYATYAQYFCVDLPSYIRSGVVRVSIAIKPDYTPQTAYIKWLLNGGVSPGGEQTFDYVDGSTYGTKTEDIVIKPSDHIEFWMKCSSNYFTYKEARILGTESAQTPTVWNLGAP